ncbi:hypothetical protein SAMN03159335_05424 [Burkholderia cepacia]|uniref:hypothetical protein n=1 Tax=Burkholderia cepacia TaxID=292 RepID=UPI0008CEF60E|nr:hypothetical protein [Burkholderia cepacia]SEU36327.1 hypothetical protein SAMN03159335_05424 [Burkholderia cepacia]
MTNTDIAKSLVEWDKVIDTILNGATDRAAHLLFERYRLGEKKDEFVVSLIARLLIERERAHHKEA